MRVGFLCLIFLGTLLQDILASCPKGCTCVNNLIICTCRGSENQDMDLESFAGIEYISKIYIHTCRQLRIPADTFAGLSVGQELEITGVQTVILEPNSFREMLKYPEQIKMVGCALRDIPENAFAGMNRVKHLWLQNVTIGTIKSGAFRGVSKIQYLYFRESTIQTIEESALGYLSDIQNLFLRGRTSIGRMHDHIFRDAKVDNIVIEDAVIEIMNAYSFSGMQRFNRMQIVNSTFRSTEFLAPTVKTKTGSGGSFEMNKINLDRLSLGPLSNINNLKFELCRIETLLATHSSPFQNVSVAHFIRTLINNVSEGSLSATRDVQNFVFDQCAIDTIHRNTFADSYRIRQIVFISTKFIQFQPDAFNRLKLRSFIMDGCKMEAIKKFAFRGLETNETFKITGSVIKSIHAHAFSQLNADYFGLEHNTFANWGDLAIEYTQAKEANISGNEFENVHTTPLSGIISMRLIFGLNKFRCDCSDNFLRLMTLFEHGDASQSHGWTFGPNLCITPENTTVHSSTFRQTCRPHNILAATELTRDLECLQTTLVTKCSCKGSRDQVRFDHKLGQQLNARTAKLLFHNCPNLLIGAHALRKFRFLTSFYMQGGTLTLESETFAHTNVLRSVKMDKVYIPVLRQRTFYNVTQLYELSITRSSIAQLDSYAFRRFYGREVTIANSNVSSVPRDLFHQSDLANFSLSLSEVYSVPLGFPEVRFTTLHHNKIRILKTPDERSDLRYSSVCLSDNQLDCRCGVTTAAKDIFERNSCNSATNVCYEPGAWRNKPITVLKHVDNNVQSTEKGPSDCSERLVIKPKSQVNGAAFNCNSRLISVFLILIQFTARCLWNY